MGFNVHCCFVVLLATVVPFLQVKMTENRMLKERKERSYLKRGQIRKKERRKRTRKKMKRIIVLRWKGMGEGGGEAVAWLHIRVGVSGSDCIVVLPSAAILWLEFFMVAIMVEGGDSEYIKRPYWIVVFVFYAFCLFVR